MVAHARLPFVFISLIALWALAVPAAAQESVPIIPPPLGEPCTRNEFVVTTPPGALLYGQGLPWAPPFLAALRLHRIEGEVGVTEIQRPAFDAFWASVNAAVAMVNDACPKGPLLTPTARMQADEKLNGAMLRAIRLVRPALEAFYTLLSDEQKARFNALVQPADGGRPSRRRAARGVKRPLCRSTAEVCVCTAEGCVGYGRRAPDIWTMPHRSWRDDDPGAYVWQ